MFNLLDVVWLLRSKSLKCTTWFDWAAIGKSHSKNLNLNRIPSQQMTKLYQIIEMNRVDIRSKFSEDWKSTCYVRWKVLENDVIIMQYLVGFGHERQPHDTIISIWLFQVAMMCLQVCILHNQSITIIECNHHANHNLCPFALSFGNGRESGAHGKRSADNDFKQSHLKCRETVFRIE